MNWVKIIEDAIAYIEVNRRIFSEWLPASSYEIAEGYNIEYYSNPEDFKMGMQDPEYYTEVWIPVKEK